MHDFNKLFGVSFVCRDCLKSVTSNVFSDFIDIIDSRNFNESKIYGIGECFAIFCQFNIALYNKYTCRSTLYVPHTIFLPTLFGDEYKTASLAESILLNLLPHNYVNIFHECT